MKAYITGALDEATNGGKMRRHLGEHEYVVVEYTEQPNIIYVEVHDGCVEIRAERPFTIKPVAGNVVKVLP